MSPSFPNFLSPAFLTFSACPLNPTDDPSSTTSTDDESPGAPRKSYLLATISQNMTLSTTPTFICIDSANASFALTIILDAPLTPAQLEGSESGNDFDIRKLKKRAYSCRAQSEEARDLTIIPTSLEKLLAISERFVESREGLKENNPENLVACQSCGRKGSEEELSRCKGCSEVWYCGKECQTKGWNEKGHKNEHQKIRRDCKRRVNNKIEAKIDPNAENISLSSSIDKRVWLESREEFDTPPHFDHSLIPCFWNICLIWSLSRSQAVDSTRSHPG
ncbi:hypothetical protein EYC84_001052 [Monilinia fructicola]|uniref:MYND-type domain-containing protein n=1 Tax=Monilinia fructicola TaxID=38448 RepID=A0A5M9JIY8_MONFR|nr:hypothetical protein EYC84_001052 [Monilinia fructicola]